jgi:hypothetical protein
VAVVHAGSVRARVWGALARAVGWFEFSAGKKRRETFGSRRTRDASAAHS